MQVLSRWKPFVLIIIFCLTNSILVQVSIASYQKEQAMSKLQYSIRTARAYITDKIRAHNSIYPIGIENIQGHQILVLPNEKDGRYYETWIYCLNHKLYEVDVMEEHNLRLESGIVVMDLENLSLEKNERCTRIKIETKEHEIYELLFKGGIS